MPIKKGVNILVADDEEIMRNLFTDILQDAGYKVTTASNGKEAEAKAHLEFFDIVFLDVHMPLGGGLKTLEVLRALTPDTTIVMMDSIFGYLSDEFKKEGAFNCIHKPFNIKEIRSIVNEIINKDNKNDV